MIKYDYRYGVDDTYTGTKFGHAELHNGFRTEGQYFVYLPDGRVQTVTYVADEYGYHPTITYDAPKQGKTKVYTPKPKPQNSIRKQPRVLKAGTRRPNKPKITKTSSRYGYKTQKDKQQYYTSPQIPIRDDTYVTTPNDSSNQSKRKEKQPQYEPIRNVAYVSTPRHTPNKFRRKEKQPRFEISNDPFVNEAYDKSGYPPKNSKSLSDDITFKSPKLIPEISPQYDSSLFLSSPKPKYQQNIIRKKIRISLPKELDRRPQYGSIRNNPHFLPTPHPRYVKPKPSTPTYSLKTDSVQRLRKYNTKITTKKIKQNTNAYSPKPTSKTHRKTTSQYIPQSRSKLNSQKTSPIPAKNSYPTTALAITSTYNSNENKFRHPSTFEPRHKTTTTSFSVPIYDTAPPTPKSYKPIDNRDFGAKRSKTFVRKLLKSKYRPSKNSRPRYQRPSTSRAPSHFSSVSKQSSYVTPHQPSTKTARPYEKTLIQRKKPNFKHKTKPPVSSYKPKTNSPTLSHYIQTTTSTPAYFQTKSMPHLEYPPKSTSYFPPSTSTPFYVSPTSKPTYHPPISTPIPPSYTPQPNYKFTPNKHRSQIPEKRPILNNLHPTNHIYYTPKPPPSYSSIKDFPRFPTPRPYTSVTGTPYQQVTPLPSYSRSNTAGNINPYEPEYPRHGPSPNDRLTRLPAGIPPAIRDHLDASVVPRVVPVPIPIEDSNSPSFGKQLSEQRRKNRISSKIVKDRNILLDIDDDNEDDYNDEDYV